MTTVRWESRFPNFAFAEFVRIAKKVHAYGQSQVLEIDLSGVTRAYCNGVVPLIAFCEAQRHQGVEVLITEPQDERQLDFWHKMGWAQMLAGGEGPNLDIHKTYTPVQRFSDHAALHRLVKAAIEILARQLDCEAGVLDGVTWVLNETADNVLLHSALTGEDPTGYFQVVSHPHDEWVEIAVADAGIGIRASLWSAEITANDEIAIQLAIQKGVTRDKEIGAGNGLAGCVRLIEATSGQLIIASGTAEVWIKGKGDLETVAVGQVPGTSVYVEIPTREAIDMTAAIWGTAPLGTFEVDYLRDDESILFRVGEEGEGFGTRGSAAEVRTKLKNIATQFPESRIQIDFAGLELLSASFVDEFIGRLWIEVGPVRFMAKYALINMSPFVRRTLEAILENRQQLEASSSLSAGPEAIQSVPTGEPPESAATRLAVLEELFSEGVLSEAEFDELKQRPQLS